jgi:hypothetical protein
MFEISLVDVSLLWGVEIGMSQAVEAREDVAASKHSSNHRTSDFQGWIFRLVEVKGE